MFIGIVEMEGIAGAFWSWSSWPMMTSFQQWHVLAQCVPIVLTDSGHIGTC